MKILIIQLARLGDVYSSWPVVRAIKREYPLAEVHFLVRKKFDKSLVGLESVDQVHILETKEILEPIADENPNVDKALVKMKIFVDHLRTFHFDTLVNLTFSPVSSYLTHALEASNEGSTQVLGYSRQKDGTLKIADEVSKYFFAQVGIGRYNRVHLVDIFSSLVGIPYKEKDWMSPEVPFKDVSLPDDYIVVHVGASESHKSLTVNQWIRFIESFLKVNVQVSIVLIGSPLEITLSKVIVQNISEQRLFDLVGKTEIYELFPVIASAQLLIGADSAPIHMASLTNTPTLNLSVGNVNFWETGPKADRGYILRSESSEDLDMEKVSKIVNGLLVNQIHPELITRVNRLESYMAPISLKSDFAWGLVAAIYFKKSFPVLHQVKARQILKKAYEVNQIILENLDFYAQSSKTETLSIVSSLEVLMNKISLMNADLEPYFNWLTAEKVAIGPASFDRILERTIEAHLNFSMILKPYLLPEELKEFHGTI